MTTQKRLSALVRLPTNKSRTEAPSALATIEQPVASNVVQFRAKAESRLFQAEEHARNSATPVWERDPAVIVMALGMCAGNVGRAANLLQTWRGGAKPIGRTAKT